MDLSFDLKIDVTDFIMKDGESTKRIDSAVGGAMFIIEQEYVKQAPGNTGAFKQGIQIKKTTILDYVVQSTAKQRGFNYPLALFTGTKKLVGSRDYGFTTGHVRANTVAFGIGGIRPNKVALRAKNQSEDRFIKFIQSKIKLD